MDVLLGIWFITLGAIVHMHEEKLEAIEKNIPEASEERSTGAEGKKRICYWDDTVDCAEYDGDFK